MPIEIKELNIKINVDGGGKKTNSETDIRQSAQTKPVNADEIIRILRKKEER